MSSNSATTTNDREGNSKLRLPKLCAVCNVLDFEKLSRPCEGLHNRSKLSRAQLHQPSFDKLVSSAETCVLCSHFLKAYVHCPSRRDSGETGNEYEAKIHERERRADLEYSEPRRCIKKLRKSDMWDGYRLSWPLEVRKYQWPPPGIEDMLGSFTVRGALITGFDLSQRLYGLTLQRIETFENELFIHEDMSRHWLNLSCASDKIPWIAGRPLAAENLPELGFEWLADCSQSHASCGRLADAQMPTRVIDVGVGMEREPKLIETGGRFGQWVTLSYPWGGAKPITTKTTYENNLKAMPLTSLPSMFRDAIRVVRKMGFQFLWIDSICIIQGDPDDWATESAQMARIYEDSAFTIAACAASSPADALIHPRSTVDITPCVFEKDGIEFTASLDYMIESSYINMPKEENSVIATRGWCFQERLLTRRVLYFGSKQLYWECRTCEHYEFCRPPLPLTGKKPEAQRVSFKQVVAKSMFALDTPFERESWYDMVESYSRCNLTNDQDVLPALSGIAQAMAMRVDDTYLAGVWLSELSANLSWVCSSSFRRKQGQVAEYRAPSWSWASVNEPVQYLIAVPSGEPYRHFELVGHEITPATKDDFGRISAGKLIVHGHIRMLDLTTPSVDLESPYYSGGNKQMTIDYWPDRPAVTNKKLAKVPCLLLAGTYKFSGLALEEVAGHPNTFRRLGLVYSSNYLFEWRLAESWRDYQLKKWLKTKKQTICLI